MFEDFELESRKVEVVYNIIDDNELIENFEESLLEVRDIKTEEENYLPF